MSYEARLINWLKDRSDAQLQRLLDAPEDKFTGSVYVDSNGNKCLAGWAGGWEFYSHERSEAEWVKEAVNIMGNYVFLGEGDDCVDFARRVKRFASAELFTRRVERPALPAPRKKEVVI